MKDVISGEDREKHNRASTTGKGVKGLRAARSSSVKFRFSLLPRYFKKRNFNCPKKQGNIRSLGDNRPQMIINQDQNFPSFLIYNTVCAI